MKELRRLQKLKRMMPVVEEDEVIRGEKEMDVF